MKITLWFNNGTQQTINGNTIKIINHKPFNQEKECMTALVDNKESWSKICLIFINDERLIV